MNTTAMNSLKPYSYGSRRWWALGAITLAVLAVGLDVTVLSVALPTLATALNASESQLQWFSAAYALALAAAMLPFGMLGDRIGRKKVLVYSLLLFGAGSFACANARSPGVFIAARILLGLAGAGLITMALAALTVLFSEKERPRAVGIWAAANFLAFPIGPILGGWLLTHYWWGWVFIMNIPAAFLGLIAVLAFVPETRGENRINLDPLGIVTSSAGLAFVTYGLIEAGQRGWGNATALSWIVAGVVILVAFGLWEYRLRIQPDGHPLVDFSLFDSPSFTWGVLLMMLSMLAMIGMLFTLPQYFQGILGTDAEGSGLRLLPLMFGIVLGAVPADRISQRVGQKLTVSIGFLIMAASLGVAAAHMAVNSSDAFIAAWMAVSGIGIGLALATAASAALVELPAENSGVGSGVMQALQKLGAPFGAAVLGSVLNAAYQNKLQLGDVPASVASTIKSSVFAGIAVAHQLNSTPLFDSVRNAFVAGMNATLWVSAGIAAVNIILALVFLPGKPRRVDGATEKKV